MTRKQSSFSKYSKNFEKGRESDLLRFLSQLQLNFNNLSLLNTALTHKSYSNESNYPVEHNERLEFLGDSVINIIVSTYLYENYPQYPEGKLSKMKAKIVSGSVLAHVARRLDLSSLILLGKGERKNGGTSNPTNLENVMEAFIGAIYLDQGLKTARDFLLPILESFIERNMDSLKDYQTALQEFCQKKYKILPVYTVISELGPDHEKLFHVKVMVESLGEAVGKGPNKQKARQDAARQLLKQMKD